MTTLLDVRELQTHFMTRDGTARAGCLDLSGTQGHGQRRA